VASAAAVSPRTKAAGRDRLIDGYRGVAVLCVVSAHCLAYRFHLPGAVGFQVTKLSVPFAEMGVQLFFVISGYIITTLLVNEESKTGRISIPAFYIRRFFRILPPLFAYFAGLLVLRSAGSIAFDPWTIRNSALFTCNTGLTTCPWWVTHTWSLAVEEQFYLAWPLILVILPQGRRVGFLLILLATLIGGFLFAQHHWHNNWISFSCIACGALYSLWPRLRHAIRARASYIAWLMVGLAFALGPILFFKPLLALTPFLITFILFSPRELPLISRVLTSSPLQAVGLCSYSLYLWQQVFLGNPSRYIEMPPLIALPVVVALSYFLIEKPCARLGHRLSAAIQARSNEPPPSFAAVQQPSADEPA
jgi:peptidoglycan/LPS O-acetylase OafA/YrhL